MQPRNSPGLAPTLILSTLLFLWGMVGILPGRADLGASGGLVLDIRASSGQTVATSYGAPTDSLQVLTYTEVNAQATDRLGLRALAIGSAEDRDADLDEVYLNYSFGPAELRGGQLRVPFGIHTFSDIEYTGLIDPPLAKSTSNWGFFLQHSATGLQVSGGSSKLTGTVALLDSDVGGHRDMVARLQGYVQPVILGFNIYRGNHEREYDDAYGNEIYVTDPVELYGFDWRFSQPYFQLRGEALFGRVGPWRTPGYYLDFFYHFPGERRLTAVARIEHFDTDTSLWGEAMQRVTLGARYVLAQNFTADLNVASGDAGDHRSGTAVLLRLTRRFGF